MGHVQALLAWLSRTETICGALKQRKYKERGAGTAAKEHGGVARAEREDGASATHRHILNAENYQTTRALRREPVRNPRPSRTPHHQPQRLWLRNNAQHPCTTCIAISPSRGRSGTPRSHQTIPSPRTQPMRMKVPSEMSKCQLMFLKCRHVRLWVG